MLSLNFVQIILRKKLNCLVALTVPRADLPSAMTAATAVAVSTQYCTVIHFLKLCLLTILNHEILYPLYQSLRCNKIIHSLVECVDCVEAKNGQNFKIEAALETIIVYQHPQTTSGKDFTTKTFVIFSNNYLQWSA